MPKLHGQGFNFCRNVADMFVYLNYYNSHEKGPRFCIIEASGTILDNRDVSVCNKIRIVREFMPIELMEQVTKPSDIPMALQWATKLGFTDVVKALLEKPFLMQVDDIAHHCQIAVREAMYDHNATILDLLINMPFPLGPSNMKVYKGFSLEFACSNGDVEETKRLLSEPIWEDKHGILVNLLQTACETRHSEIVKLLVPPPPKTKLSEQRSRDIPVIDLCSPSTSPRPDLPKFGKHVPKRSFATRRKSRTKHTYKVGRRECKRLLELCAEPKEIRLAIVRSVRNTLVREFGSPTCNKVILGMRFTDIATIADYMKSVHKISNLIKGARDILILFYKDRLINPFVDNKFADDLLDDDVQVSDWTVHDLAMFVCRHL